MSASDSPTPDDADAPAIEGAVDTSDRGHVKSTSPRNYDFLRPSRISKERLNSLAAVFSLITKGLESWFAGRIRGQISIELESLEPRTYGEFVQSLPTPCTAYLVGLGSESLGTALVEMGQDFSFFVVDRFQGGRGPIFIPDRSLTLVERALVQLVVDRISTQMKEAWRDHVGLDPRVIGFESVPEMIQVASPQDPVLVANLAVSIGDISSVILFCLPFSLIEKFFSDGSGRRRMMARGSAEERAQEEAWMVEHVTKASLPVSARLPTFRLPLGLIAEMKVGDIVSTGLPLDVELEVRVAGQPKWMANGGREGHNRALWITREIRPDS
jgi:flagellar motor switch protein FliM